MAASPEARRAAATVACKGIVVVLGGLTSIVVSRALLPSGRGSYYVLVALATMATSLGHLSIEQAQAYLWSEGADRRALAANAVVTGVAVGLVSAGATFAVVVILGSTVVPVAGVGLLAVALVTVPVGTTALFVAGLLYLSNRLLIVNVAAVLAAVVQCGVLLGLWAAHDLTVTAVVVVWAATSALPLLVTVRAVRPRLSAFDPAVFRRALSLGARYHVGMAALFLLYRLDALLLNGMSTAAQVGLYSLAVTLAEMVYLLTDTVAQLVLPAQMSSGLDESVRQTARAIRANVVLAFAAFVALAAASPWLVPALYGGAFRDSVPMLLWLGPGVVALAVARPAGGVLIRLNRPLRISALALCAMLLNVGLNLVLIPRYRGIGASIASSAAYIGLAGAYLVWLKRATGLPVSAVRPRPAELMAAIRAGRPDGPTGASPADAAATIPEDVRNLS
ncbi:MAG TPA: polysaccharide biosynthesis C-terminal domain-containing protein [Acidimicrobiales bacterium]|nr:polysaccharide biosynthesis C-terminal domain-containing protein [Acidimicrobiales bacterium]